MTGSRSRSKEAAECVEFLVTRQPGDFQPVTYLQTSSATSDRYKSSRAVICSGVALTPALVCTRQISIWKIHETYKCSCQSQLAPLTPLSFGLVASCRWRGVCCCLPSVCRVHARVSTKYSLPFRLR